MKPNVKMWVLVCALLVTIPSLAQKAYFIDGYHGGVYGHYPTGYTQFIVNTLNNNPAWKINLEIEPETWDSVLVREPAALKELQKLFADQSLSGRIEYVSPAYGQSYFYNISGESIIRHFIYGIKKVRQYFPKAEFTTYSTEEPCFTSALPQLLLSLGYKYASLKNPNTCWGGYVKAYGGELLNWVGPDGSKLVTVPRYATEGFLPNSTWQTEAWTNAPKYVNKALAYGIKNPVGMTLQDAGWKNGPWLGDSGYQPTVYNTWRGYIENNSIRNPTQDWKFSQEDLHVSLVWGAQVLQRLAQQVRASENALVAAEKMAALAKVYQNATWPQAAIDDAWRTLMLAQHHDCWIVPYNGGSGQTWADKVAKWTGATNHTSDSIVKGVFADNGSINASNKKVRVYNTTGAIRNEVVKLEGYLPVDTASFTVVDAKNKSVPMQVATDSNNRPIIYFKATVPALGYSTYQIINKPQKQANGAQAFLDANGNAVLETDLYKLVIDKCKGGTIKSLIAKKAGNKEFVDANNERRFNELRGNFFNDGGFHATSDSPVAISITEAGPVAVTVQIKGTLSIHPFTQTIALKQGEKRIDCSLKIDWKGNVGIGSAYKQHGGLKATDYQKPFYDDSQKLLALFPLNFSTQKVYKDAPFDVTESGLENTFFSRWDSIKNNIMVSWVDVFDEKSNIGFALFTDHTTTYAHGNQFPLGLNVQYSGAGLWGRNYIIAGPTEIKYALLPHTGKWDKAGVSTEVANWQEPLLASLTEAEGASQRSLLDVRGTGFQVTSVLVDSNDLLSNVHLRFAAGSVLSAV